MPTLTAASFISIVGPTPHRSRRDEGVLLDATSPVYGGEDGPDVAALFAGPGTFNEGHDGAVVDEPSVAGPREDSGGQLAQKAGVEPTMSRRSSGAACSRPMRAGGSWPVRSASTGVVGGGVAAGLMA